MYGYNEQQHWKTVSEAIDEDGFHKVVEATNNNDPYNTNDHVFMVINYNYDTKHTIVKIPNHEVHLDLYYSVNKPLLEIGTRLSEISNVDMKPTAVEVDENGCFELDDIEPTDILTVYSIYMTKIRSFITGYVAPFYE